MSYQCSFSKFCCLHSTVCWISSFKSLLQWGSSIAPAAIKISFHFGFAPFFQVWWCFRRVYSLWDNIKLSDQVILETNWKYIKSLVYDYRIHILLTIIRRSGLSILYFFSKFSNSDISPYLERSSNKWETLKDVTKFLLRPVTLYRISSRIVRCKKRIQLYHSCLQLPYLNCSETRFLDNLQYLLETCYQENAETARRELLVASMNTARSAIYSSAILKWEVGHYFRSSHVYFLTPNGIA